MLYYGNLINVQDDCVVYNFTSLSETYERLDLIPPNTLGASNEYDFDVRYMQWILSDDHRFAEMFKIVENLYEGFDVYVITSDETWAENLTESLLKLIQQRYGYNSTRVNCFEDVLAATPTSFDTGFGLFNLDQDEDRYCYYLELLNQRGFAR